MGAVLDNNPSHKLPYQEQTFVHVHSYANTNNYVNHSLQQNRKQMWIISPTKTAIARCIRLNAGHVKQPWSEFFANQIECSYQPMVVILALHQTTYLTVPQKL